MRVRMEYTEREAKRVLFSLIAFEVLLVLAYVAIFIWSAHLPWGEASRVFDLDDEVSIPTCFSTVQFFAIGAVLFLVSLHNERRHHVPSGFLVAVALFVFLSADEGASIHENITVVAKQLGMRWMLIKDHGAWIMVYAVAGVAIAILSAKTLAKCWKHYPRELSIGVIGGLILLAGAVGVEVISYLFLRSGDTPMVYRIFVAVEEFLVMAGASVMLYSVLLLARKLSSPVPGEGIVVGPSSHPHRYTRMQTSLNLSDPST